MMPDSLPTITTLLTSPATSYWLRDALRSALDRDPVDAADDAELLAIVLVQRAARVLGGAA